MIVSKGQTALDEALRNCESEPIHIPGRIQPHGALLGVDPFTFEIQFASRNLEEFVGKRPIDVVGQELPRAVGMSIADRVRLSVDRDDLSRPVHLVSTIETPEQDVELEVSIHRRGSTVMIELETADTAKSTLDLGTWLRGFQRWGNEWDSVIEFSQMVADEIRSLSGYDRTMVYRFHPDDHGEVIAASAAPGIDSFLGLHFPASDIPRQARELFLVNKVRVLADSLAEDSPMIALPEFSEKHAIDMSVCQLRGFSPVHLEYLNNMGVRATLVTSIVNDGRLWGLVVCNHMSPRIPSHGIRAACEFLSDIISVQVAAHQTRDQIRAQRAAAAFERKIFRTLADNTDWKTVVLNDLEPDGPPISSNGMAIVEGTSVWTKGTVPETSTILDIVAWIKETQTGTIFSTDALGDANSAFRDISLASGLIAAEIGPSAPLYLVWFRREMKMDVSWGGNPDKGMVTTDGESVRLSPRKSFDAWQTEVRGRSAPWSGAELATAREVRTTIVETVLRASLARGAMTESELVRVRKAVAASSEAILIADGRGRPTFVNQAFCDLFKVSIDELPALSVCAPIVDPVVRNQIIAASLQSGGCWHGECEIAVPGMEPISVALRVDSVTDEAGNVVGFIAVHFDLTERNRARRQLEEHAERLEAARIEIERQALILADAKARAEAANRAKSDFLANMCHEIRTPLNGVIGLSELLLDTHLDEAQHKLASTVRMSGDALLTVINDILDISKIEAGKMVITSTHVAIAPMLEEVKNLLEPQARRNDVAILIDAGDSFPTDLLGDAIRIRQILTNLAGNAVKFTEKGEVRISAELISVNPESATLRISVKDTGIGIPKAAYGSIFESFTQGESGNTRASSGTGLGLAICRKLADLMNGRLEFESEEGKGSTFWLELTLPRLSQVSVGLARPAEIAPSKPPARSQKVLSVLVAEDHPTNQLVAKGLVGRLGHQVVIARNGREAVEARVAGSFDLILMDIQMPILDGRSATTEIRRWEQEHGRQRIPIIAVTAFALQEERDRCLEVGMDGYIPKPITPASLREMFEQFASTPEPRQNAPVGADAAVATG